MDKVLQIQEEIERRLMTADYNINSKTELQGLLSFVKSLPEKTINEDFEKEWKSHLRSKLYSKGIKGLAEHFIEWQKGKDEKEILTLKDQIESLEAALKAKDEVMKMKLKMFETPETPFNQCVEVASRMKYIDDDLKPIADFILDYSHWDLHADEWNQPTIIVPVFRVLDALVHRGKPYCECGG